MIPERETEYDDLLAYVGHFATVVWKISPAADIHPANTLEKVVEQFGKSKALAGLRQAANDTIEDAKNWGSETKFTVGDAFKSAILPLHIKQEQINKCDLYSTADSSR
jgi:hypothetical protein